MSATRALAALGEVVGDDGVILEPPARYLADETEARGLRGRADAVVLPRTANEVAQVVAWCYEHGVHVTPRGGGTGFAAGAVPIDGGIVLSLERLDRVRRFDPLLWRMEVEAGVTTATIRRLARQNGLFFPPDPGAAEQSQIGGNIATNAGGPHAFKYGVTGTWVTGIEAAVPPGELIAVGGPIRKDVAGYDLKSLLIGSEGTLGVVTAAWLKLIPAPEAAWPAVALFRDTRGGCDAIEAIVGNGIPVAALEFLDAPTVAATAASFPARIDQPGFMVIVDADGYADEAVRIRDDAVGVFGESALAVHAPESPREVEALWRWRDGVSFAVQSVRGGKLSEDIVVPLDRLADAIEGTAAIGVRHGLGACAWGHAGDGNLHSTFLVVPDDVDELRRAHEAADDLFALALELGGSISGEHGTGYVKRGHLEHQWPAAAVDLHRRIKDVFDPKGLLNAGKKI